MELYSVGAIERERLGVNLQVKAMIVVRTIGCEPRSQSNDQVSAFLRTKDKAKE